MNIIKFIIQISPRNFVLAALAGIISGFSLASLLALTNKALHNTEMVNTTTMVAYFLLIVVVVVSKVSSTVLLTSLSQQSIAKLRMRLSQEILSAPLINLELIGSHKLLASLSTDITSIGIGVMRLPSLFMNSALLLGCLGYLLWLSPLMFFASVCIIVVSIMIYKWPQSRAVSLLKQARETDDELYKGFRAVCEGTKELKMHQSRRNDFFSGAFKQCINDYAHYRIKAAKYYSVAGSFSIIMLFVGIGSLIFIIPSLITIDAESLVGYVIVFLFMLGPIDSIISFIPDVAKTSISFKKVQSLGLSLNKETSNDRVGLMPNENDRPRKLEYKKSLKMVDVVHSYYRELESSYFQLGPMNLEFKPGELIFLIGGNGSGKTTLAKILLGLYSPESGRIELDGIPVDESNIEAYRQTFSAVFVDFFLFDELLGMGDTSLDEKSHDYLEKLQLSHKVTVKGGKLSTIQLSQGQRKRLTLMSAYLENRQFCVFDEWAADQDPEFKNVFYRIILPELRAQGKTVLIISHDEQYFDVADRYIKMNSGKVIVEDSLDKVVV